MSVALTQNKTTLDEIAKLLNNECGVLFPTDNSSRVACDLIADGLTALLPEIDKGLTTLAWNIPFGFCSVFIPVCKQPCCSDAFAPEQVHLSFPSSDLSTMRAAWVTLNATATSTVQWGASPSLGKSAKGSNRTYTEGGWVGQIHEAVMTGLTPGTTCECRGDGSMAGPALLPCTHSLPPAT